MAWFLVLFRPEVKPLVPSERHFG